MATWPTITDDAGDNLSGTIVNNTNVWTPIQTYIGGAWTAVTHSAGNFTASGAMTWTVASGDMAVNRYVVIGKTMIWEVTLGSTTIGGTPGADLYILIPGGHTASNTNHWTRVSYCNNNGTVYDDASVRVFDGTHIVIARNDSANWTAGTDNNYFYFQIMLEVS